MSARCTIVMPHCNHGAFLREAVDSALAQDEAVELVVVDDGSRDPASLKALESIEALPLTLLRQQKSGPSVARNRAIELARTPYILPLDADDRIEPGYVRLAADLLDAEPGIGIVSCEARTFGRRVGPWRLPEPDVKTMLRGNCLHACSMFRRADWERAGGYAPQLQALEDWDFWLALLELDLGMHRLPQELFHYRKHGNWRQSRSKRISRRREVEQIHRIRQRHAGLYARHPELLLELLHEESLRRAALQDARLGARLRAWLRRRHLDT